jgi:RNA polymerase sigma-70 factor (ECF subfamily)
MPKRDNLAQEDNNKDSALRFPPDTAHGYGAPRAYAEDLHKSQSAKDAALLEGLRQNRPEACAALYDRFAPGIHRFAALRLSGDSQTAEDLVIQTLADAVRDIRRFNPRKSTLSAWLYGIARRRVQAEIRRRTMLKAVPLWAQIPIENLPQASDGRDLASEVVGRLEAQRLIAVMSVGLSDIEMEALTLSCVDQLSAREIGRILGRSERAVHSLLHRARRKAKERLAQDEG